MVFPANSALSRFIVHITGMETMAPDATPSMKVTRAQEAGER